jgi:outer membrane protein W
MSRRHIALVAALGVMLTCQRTQAQKWEASAFAGYTPSVDIDRRATELNQLDVRGAFTWGFQAARLFTPHWGAEVVWTQQKSALEGGTASSGPFDFFTMTIRQLQGHVLYEFGGRESKMRPFVFGGVGATFFSATDLQSETKLSFDYGAGLNYFAWRGLGLRTHVRFKPTSLNDKSAGDVCDPFGFCQSWLSQIEFAAGVVVRF